jgi:Sigma 54 modulation/S30EA ribosomal protein C terminus
MISAVLAHHQLSPDHARVRIASLGGSGLVQVNLRVCGAPARIQVPGPSVVAAIAAAATRLHRQIARLSTVWEQWPWPDPERRALGLGDPAPIARRKLVRLRRDSPCQAAARLAAMDYDVHLFVDAQTGEDTVVYRAGPTGLRLSRQRSMRPPALPGGPAMTVSPRPVPVLTPAQAASTLARGWLPFVFFTDPDTRRGSLLYRRYTGDLGLISPA